MEGIEGTHGIGADALSKGLEHLGLTITTGQAPHQTALRCLVDSAALLACARKGHLVLCLCARRPRSL